MAHRSTAAPSSNIKQMSFIDHTGSVDHQNSNDVEIGALSV